MGGELQPKIKAKTKKTDAKRQNGVEPKDLFCVPVLGGVFFFFPLEYLCGDGLINTIWIYKMET